MFLASPLPHGAVGWSAVYDCDILWSYSLFRSQSWPWFVVPLCGFVAQPIKSLHAKYETNTLTNRGSYMSADVLLTLLNKLGKRGLSGILSLFRNSFNKFNKTRV